MMLVGTSSRFDPDSLALLQAVFDDCCRKLDGFSGASDRSQLRVKRQLVAARIMALAETGVTDPDQLERQALAGLLPGSPH